MLGSSFDIGTYGQNVRAGFPRLDSSLIASFGYLRFDMAEDDHITFFHDMMDNLLIEQFRRDRPNLHAIIHSLATLVQDVEDTLWDMGRFRAIDTATGAQLDAIGAIVGCPRSSANDDVYRADIYFQIAVNVSSGEPEIMIAVLQKVTKATRIDYAEQQPAHVILTINENFEPIPSNVYDRMQRIRPAGVSLEIRSTPSATPFIFNGEGDFPPYFVGEGFGETGVAWTAVGGNIVELIS